MVQYRIAINFKAKSHLDQKPISKSIPYTNSHERKTSLRYFIKSFIHIEMKTEKEGLVERVVYFSIVL